MVCVDKKAPAHCQHKFYILYDIIAVGRLRKYNPLIEFQASVDNKSLRQTGSPGKFVAEYKRLTDLILCQRKFIGYGLDPKPSVVIVSEMKDHIMVKIVICRKDTINRTLAVDGSVDIHA